MVEIVSEDKDEEGTSKNRGEPESSAGPSSKPGSVILRC